MSTTNINIPKPVIDYNDLLNQPTLVTEHSQLNLDDGTNPHGTTKSDVGLGSVDDTSDLDKPISSATQTALDLKVDITSISAVGFSNDYDDLDNKPTIPTVLSEHSQLTLDDGTNPHGTTKSDVGLGNVPNLDTTDAVNKAHDAVTLTGTPNYLTIVGQAITRGLIDLASHVTNRLGFSNLPTGTARSIVGRAGSGNGDVGNISAGNNSILGRNGSGDVAFNSATETKEILSLSNVDNTSDLDKPISTATQTALNNKQDTLVSGTNIKTVNGNSLLGSGNITTADVNPTSGVYPINETGSFVDSKLSVYDSQNNTRQIQQPNVINKIGLFTDANNGQSSLAPGSGIELGVANLNPDWFGTDTFSDCSIVSAMGEPGFFGSTLHIKTQPQIQSFLAPFNTQQTQISIVPGNFVTGGYGVGIKTETPDCPLTVFNPSGFQQPGQFNNAIARFDWDMGGVVFPKVDSNNQSMMAPEDGMVLYNTTVRKLQVYSFGSWVDLH